MSTARRIRSTGVAALATFSLLAGTAVVANAGTTDPEVVSIDILSINDFHGRIQADGTSAGAAVLAGAVTAQRQVNPNSLFVSAGDSIGASTFASASQQDNPTIDALGAGGLDLSVVGNHEFDRGFDDLVNRVIPRYAAATEKIEDSVGADYALGANVYYKDTGEPALKEYTIRDIDGVQVGFIGTVTADTATLVSPAGITDIEFGNQLEAVNRVAEELSDGDEDNGEAQVLVLLTHDGSEATSCENIAAEETAYSELVLGASEHIDAIFSGHTHKAYNCEFAVPGSDDTRPVIQAHQYGTTLGKISLGVDPDTGDVRQFSSELIALVDEGGEPAFDADPAVAQIVDEAVAESDEVGKQTIGKISADILRGGEEPGDDRGAESTLGNTVADIHLWATSNEEFGGEPAQIAFMNPGGLREDLLYGEDGSVSYKAAAEVQPFANNLITFDLNGTQLREALEQQWQPEGSSRPKLHLGISEGLSYTYVEDAARGEHVKSVTFNGEPVAEGDNFRVVANGFLAAGGDNFPAFAEGANHADSGQVDLDATVNYFKAHDVVDPAPLGRAILAGTEWATVSLSSSTTAPGESVTVQVSGLDEGALITASALDGAVEVTDIPAADSSGTTSFVLEVPADQTEGEYSLTISQVGREDISVPLVISSEPPAPTEQPTEEPTSEPTEPSATPTSEPTKTPDTSKTPDQDRDLAKTGFSATWIGMAAGIILLLGIILVLLRSRGRKNTH